VGKLLDLIGSVNGQIISYSDLYRFNLLLVVLLAVLNLALNWYFIAVLQWGIVGAAAASLIALGTFNLVKAVFIYLRMGLQPLLPEIVWPVLLSVALLLFWTWVPLDFPPLLNIVLRSLLTGAVFVGYLFTTDHLPELREFAVKTVRGIRTYL
jgi:O-antigen/teichoic acid export membrane protein